MDIISKLIRDVTSPIMVRGVVHPVEGRSDFSWSSYWSTLISATVENAAPTHVVLTFPAAQTSLGASDFTIAGFTIASASWTGPVLTLVTNETVVQYHGNLTITFITTGGTATVINNVDDTKTVLWYDAADASTITKDGSNRVSAWNSKVGTGHLAQATDDAKPIWSADGILFDGADDFMVTPDLTLNQPVRIYLVLKQITWTSSDAIYDGKIAGYTGIRQTPSTPLLRLANTIQNAAGNSLALNTFGIIRALSYGANSKFRVNELIEYTGDVGANHLGGIYMGTYRLAGSGMFAHFQIKEAIFRNNDDDAATEAAIYDYLVNKFFF